MLATVTELTWEDGNADDAITAAAYRGYVEGANDAYLPFVVYAPGSQFTRISVLNTENTTATLSISYINREGDSDFVISNELLAGVARTYDTHIPGPTVPDLMATAYANINEFWGGAIHITSTAEIAAVSTNHWQQWSMAYNGLSQGARKNYVPSVERRVIDGVWKGFSIIIAQCVETGNSCNVKIESVDADTGSIDLTLTKIISPGAALGANTRNGGDWDFDDFAVLGDAWVGSAIVKSRNSTDLAVIAYTIRPDSQRAAATSAA